MSIIRAKIVWLPQKITTITKDYLADEGKIPWDENHLSDIRKYMKQDGLIFPGVVFKNEIHCGHYRFKVAKEMGYKGMEVYEANSFEEALHLTKFSELCYKHYKEIKELKYL